MADKDSGFASGQGDGLFFDIGSGDQRLVVLKGRVIVDRDGKDTGEQSVAMLGDISAANPTFSKAVLDVNVDFATNTTGAAYVAVTNALAGFGFDADALAELPGGKVYGSIGALLAALAAAVAWLKKKALVGGLTGGVPDDPKVHDFFTKSDTFESDHKLKNAVLEESVNALIDYKVGDVNAVLAAALGGTEVA